MIKSLGRFRAFPSFFRSNTKLQANNRELQLQVLLESLIIIKIIHSETVNLVGALPRLQNKSPLFFFCILIAIHAQLLHDFFPV